MIKAVWDSIAYKRFTERALSKSIFTCDPSTGRRYRDNVKAKIREMESMVLHEALPPPPAYRHKATLVANPGSGDVIIYEFDPEHHPKRIIVLGVFPYIPDPIP